MLSELSEGETCNPWTWRFVSHIVPVFGTAHDHGRAEERTVVRQPRREIIEHVDEIDPQRVARANAECRPGGGALIDVHDRRLTGDRHRLDAAGEGGVEQTVAAGADLRLDELLGRGGAAEVEPGQDQSPAGNAHGGHPGPGRELHETPPPDHVLPLLGLPGAIRMRRNDWMW